MKGLKKCSRNNLLISQETTKKGRPSISPGPVIHLLPLLVNLSCLQAAKNQSEAFFCFLHWTHILLESETVTAYRIRATEALQHEIRQHGIPEWPWAAHQHVFIEAALQLRNLLRLGHIHRSIFDIDAKIDIPERTEHVTVVVRECLAWFLALGDPFTPHRHFFQPPLPRRSDDIHSFMREYKPQHIGKLFGAICNTMFGISPYIRSNRHVLNGIDLKLNIATYYHRHSAWKEQGAAMYCAPGSHPTRANANLRAHSGVKYLAADSVRIAATRNQTISQRR